MILNENNIQAPFQYKISENTFELLKRNGELELNTDNVQVKVFEGQRLFCADIGYTVDGPLEEMEFLIDDIKVYPVLLEELEDLKNAEVKDNEIYLIEEDINFKSIIFFPLSDFNKNFKFNITTYSSTFSSFMFDEIAKKFNSFDINIPVKNYYNNIDYKVNDIIKYKGYLYRVFKEFKSDDTDYYLKTNCNLITPFKKLELNTEYEINDLVEYDNNFFIVQEDFNYESTSNLNDILKPIHEIIEWNDNIKKVYKNQIILKDDFCYLVLSASENYTFDELLKFKKIDYLNKASNTFYDDTNSSFGNNTNTVQKAIEKLKYDKQGSLRSGNNIDLNGNTISVIGGTNKEYVINNNYQIYDLIIYDSKLYKVNENFVAADWTKDRNKLTLISSGGSSIAAEASQVEYDNSRTNLQYISGYDFPKFKAQIPNTINLVLTDINKTKEYAAIIKKHEDGSYILNCQLDNIDIEDSLLLLIKSLDNDMNIYRIYSELSQFFEFSTSLNFEHPYNLTSDEINISGLDKEDYIFGISVIENFVGLIIGSKSLIPKSNYNLTLNIKNKVLRNQDNNLFVMEYGTDEYAKPKVLTLEENNGDIKLSGSMIVNVLKNNLGAVGYLFYSPIIENYFNLSSSKTTKGITSSTGKAVKFIIEKTNEESELYYMLVISYEDDSYIHQGEVFTLNITPDENFKAEPIYSAVNNVQHLGEALAKRLDKLDLIADGEEHPTGTYYYNADGGRKPIYYRYLDLRSYSAYTQDFNTSSNEWNIDLICNDNMGYDIRGNGSYFYQFNSRGDFVNNVIRDAHIYFDSKTKRFGLYIEQYSGTTHRAGLFKIKYTRTIDSLEY